MRRPIRRAAQRRNARLPASEEHRFRPGSHPLYRGGAFRSGAPSYRSRFFGKVLTSFILFTLIYFIFQNDSPVAIKAQAVIKEVMERDFNFQAVADWYEGTIGGFPAIIPTFSKTSRTEVKDDLPTAGWQLPVNGNIQRAYSSGHPYVAIGDADSSLVSASASGLVTFVGEKDGWGECVVVQHAGGFETWYGPFDSVRVEPSDWVDQGQLLGKHRGDGAGFQFGIKRGGAFVDPLDVIDGE